MKKYMKKTGAFILAAALMSSNVLAADVTVEFEETEVSFSESEPVIENGSVIISLNDISDFLDQLGYEMTAISRADDALTYKNEGRTIEVTGDDENLIINGTTIPYDEQEDNIFIPLRAFCEAAEITVEWDGDTKTVLLSLGEAPEKTEALQIPSEDEEAIKAAVEGMKRVYCVMGLMFMYSSSNPLNSDKETIDSLPGMAESYIDVLNSLDLPEQDKILAEKLEAFIYAANDCCQAEYEYSLSDDKEVTEKYYDIYNKKQEAAENFNTTARELSDSYLTEELTSKYYCFENSEEETEAAVSYLKSIDEFMTVKLLKYLYPSSDEEENLTADDLKKDMASVVNMLKESEPSESFLLLKYFSLGAFDLFSEHIDCTQNPEFDEDDPFNFYNIKAECCLYAGGVFFDKAAYDLGLF